MRGLCLGEVPRPFVIVFVTGLVQSLVFYAVYAGAAMFAGSGTDAAVLQGLAAAIASVLALALAASYMGAKIDAQACVAGAANLIAAGAAVSAFVENPLLPTGVLSIIAFGFFVISFFLGTE